ncbi:uncharacterized protein B0H18DRAFT_952324 [Fomitopsis serialis]|uniref:uncharacterized protein n=1 Tax=Fomitopsis serialis TaxID=139415 RepID=UPI002008A732|nr:uncharacterized protein B0H18DRAFT_952324 [Neoantrodia serialis]KAH9932639.1 hypothetical protein B0H18DRAFT_952324 [Neoantrodia serialis]
MLPRLLPSSATDVESDSDSLASPLDAPIAHWPTQGPYLATVQAPGQSPGEPQTLPNVIPSGLYGLAPYPDAQDDSPQYSAVSDSAVNHQNWDYLQETDVSDSPTSAVSEPFFPQHDRGDYVHGFEAQYSNAATDYEASGCHSDHAQYAVACDRRTGGYTASAGADMLPDYAVQQGSMSSGCDAGVDMLTIIQPMIVRLHIRTQVAVRIIVTITISVASRLRM